MTGVLKSPLEKGTLAQECKICKMKQTPAHQEYNSDLLAIVPAGCRHVVEVGCSTGALAAAYKTANPQCFYVGIEIDSQYAASARQSCDQVIIANI